MFRFIIVGGQIAPIASGGDRSILPHCRGGHWDSDRKTQFLLASQCDMLQNVPWEKLCGVMGY